MRRAVFPSLLLFSLFALGQSRSTNQAAFVPSETARYTGTGLVYPLLNSLKHISDTVRYEISVMTSKVFFLKSVVIPQIRVLCNRDTLDFSSSRSTFGAAVSVCYAQPPSRARDTVRLVDFKCIQCNFLNELRFFEANVSHFSFGNRFKDLKYEECRLTQFEFAGDTCNNLMFSNCSFAMKTLYLPPKILGDLEFTECQMPDTIDFTRIHVSGDIKINGAINRKKTVLIIDDGFIIQNLKCLSSSYHILFSIMDPEKIEYYLREILETQKKIGSTKDIELADIALKDYQVCRGDFILGFQRFLWNYGYSKELLLQRMIFCFFIFYIINLFKFRTLIREVYIIPNLEFEYQKLSEYRNRKIKYRRLPVIVFLYSCIIFFGWKMDIGKFTFKHLLLSLYLFTFYLIGLGLLFYAIGLLLHK